ncbi:MAG: hypothetical protein K8I30_22475, partial [Anaerolineae bacterium]|nr:hypothetical protein [Anaerolineae bacterium]
LDLVITTTGGGFVMDEIGAFLVAAVVNTGQPLFPNPAGVEQLEAALAAVSQPQASAAVAPLPEMAGVISGQTFVFEPNSLDIGSMTLEFNDVPEAMLHFSPAGSEQMFDWPVALDGVYRLTSGDYDLPLGMRGQWTDDKTFTFEYDEIANNSHVMLEMRFDGDRVLVQSHDMAGGGDSTQLEGSLQNP